MAQNKNTLPDAPQDLYEFIAFSNFMGASLVKFLYWMGLVVIVLVCLAGAKGALAYLEREYENSVINVLLCLSAILFMGCVAAIQLRVVCEIVSLKYLSFRHLEEIRDGIASLILKENSKT